MSPIHDRRGLCYLTGTKNHPHEYKRLQQSATRLVYAIPIKTCTDFITGICKLQWKTLYTRVITSLPNTAGSIDPLSFPNTQTVCLPQSNGSIFNPSWGVVTDARASIMVPLLISNYEIHEKVYCTMHWLIGWEASVLNWNAIWYNICHLLVISFLFHLWIATVCMCHSYLSVNYIFLILWPKKNQDHLPPWR